MDLDLPAEAEAHRQRVRRFLDETLGPDGRPPPDWFSRLAAAGYTAPHWPPPWGRAASPVEQLVVDEELRRRGVHRPVNPIGLGWAGPTILLAGTEEQQQRWLPGILDGSEIWCQLFSEPVSGSDLASLTTRAERDGDEWVVHGQKVWTSLAAQARYGILLARTGPSIPKHQGISYFVVDMHSPGIEIRPIRQMTGAAEFNEVFLDGVRIPAGNLVGHEGDGWRLAQLYVEAELLRVLRLRTISAQVHRHEPGPEASVRKLLADHHGQKVFRLAVELCGAHGMLLGPNPDRLPGEFPWSVGFLFSPALTIGGGTSEVQRNIIAERVLGLPRDPA